MTSSELMLEYAKLLLAAPVMTAATIMVLALVFRRPIGVLISRIGTIKLPGGGEVTTQYERTEIAIRSSGVTPPEPLPGSTDLPALPAANADLEARLRAEREAAYLWEYRYLNYFLVRLTQEILDWLATRTQPTTFANFDAWVSDHVIDPRERDAVLNALRKHHLIQIDNTLIRVTPKGHEYREWRGALPARGI